MITRVVADSTMSEGRKRLSRGSAETHVAHWQLTVGTPVDVPLPRMVNFIYVVDSQKLKIDSSVVYTLNYPLPTIACKDYTWRSA
jgi:hypothetical protein